jgi:hypothetical protein
MLAMVHATPETQNQQIHQCLSLLKESENSHLVLYCALVLLCGGLVNWQLLYQLRGTIQFADFYIVKEFNECCIAARKGVCSLHTVPTGIYTYSGLALTRASCSH